MDQKIIIILVILFLMNCYSLLKKNNIEKMTDTSPQLQQMITTTVNQVYKADIGAIRNLSTLSQKLQSKDGVIMPGNLTVRGSFNYLPTGSIIAYNKTVAPKGWALCDGKNGTPDLRGRFIYGAGSSGYELNKRGGETSHKLTVDEIPSHNHTMNETGNHNHQSTLQKWYRSFKGDSGGGHPLVADSGSGYNPNTTSSGNHKHTINNTGGNKAHNNMPPFYVLSYIMKL